MAATPAIVSEEVFDRVQVKRAQNRSFARRNHTACEYLLRALVSCGHCRTACLGRSGRGYAYCTCRGKQAPINSRKEERGSARFLPVQQLDECVWNDLCELLTHPDQIAQALQRAQGGEWLPQELQAWRENLRKAQKSLDSQLERLTEAYLAGVVPLEEYRRRRFDLEGQKEALALQAQQLEADVDRQAELAGRITSLESFCQEVQKG